MPSGSIQIPNCITCAIMRLDNSFNVQPSFFSLANQSPKPVLSSCLFPNQPSSITNNSIPSCAASFAILISVSPVKSK